MSVRVLFYLCHAGGLADEFLAGPLDDFEAWCTTMRVEFPDDIEPTIPPLLRAVRATGHAALRATTASEAEAIDRLMDTYFGDFCVLHARGLLREADGSSLRVDRYEGMFDRARGSLTGSAAWHLWNFMFTGRGVGRDEAAWPVRWKDRGFRLSWWTSEEVAVLHEAFETAPMPAAVDENARESARQAIGRAYEDGSGLLIQVS